VRQPSTIAWQLGFPIVSVLLFVYVFGRAMDTGGGDYKAFAIPGMFAMTMDRLPALAIQKYQRLSR